MSGIGAVDQAVVHCRFGCPVAEAVEEVVMDVTWTSSGLPRCDSSRRRSRDVFASAWTSPDRLLVTLRGSGGFREDWRRRCGRRFPKCGKPGGGVVRWTTLAPALDRSFAVWKLRGGVRECGERLCLWWCDVLVKPSVVSIGDGAALWAPAFCAGLLRGDPVGFQNFVLGVGSSVQIL